MEFLEIERKDLIGIRIIDEQHSNIADIVNLTYSSVLELNKKESLIHLRELLELLESHFETEESLMKEVKFPGYISHKLEHDRFYHQILTTIENYKKGTENFGIEQLKRIRTWFFNHIEMNDKKCGLFFLDNGIN